MPVRLLLIEDNPGDVVIFREKLRESDLDFELVHTQHLKEALELIAEEGFEIILVDLSLPDASGLDAVIKVVAVAPTTPVVVLTGLDDAGIAAQARHEGAIDYLVKWYQDGPTMARYIRYAIAQGKVERRSTDEPSATPAQAPSDSEAEEEPPTAGPVPEQPALDPLQAALDAADDGIAIVLDDGTIEYANKTAKAWFEDGNRYPWSLTFGRLNVTAGEVNLVQSVSAVKWHGSDAFVITLRPIPDSGVESHGGALRSAAEASLEFLAQSERRDRWMTGVLRDALNLEQLVRREVRPAPALMDLVERVNMVVRQMHPIALERGTPINVMVHREKIATTTDRQALEMLLRRALLDSLLTASGSSIEVEVSFTGGEPRIKVSWEMSVAHWAALPEPTRELSRRVLVDLCHRAGGSCLFDEDGTRDLVTISLPPGSDATKHDQS